MSYHELNCRDLHREMSWVFYEYEGERLVMRPEYRPLCCKGCGILDCLAALKFGVSKSFRGPRAQRDAAFSDDSQLVVSNKCLDVFNRVAKGLIYVFDIPGDDRYKIIYPKQIHYPPSDLPITNTASYLSGEAFHNYKGICSKCGKFKEITMYSKNYTVPDGIKLAGLELGRDKPIMAWIVNDEIMNALSQGLTGWWIRKNAFANDRDKPVKKKK